MLGLVFAALIGALGLYYALATHAQAVTVSQNVRVEAEAQNFQVYAGAVTAYREAHSGFTGAVPLAALVPNLPPGYSAIRVWTNLTVAGGDTYIYGMAESATAARVISFLGNPTSVGVNRNGLLWSPAYGNTGTGLPQDIPQGALVEVETLP